MINECKTISKTEIQKDVIKDIEYINIDGIKNLANFYNKILNESICNSSSYRHIYALEYLKALKLNLRTTSDSYFNIDEYLGFNVFTKILPLPNNNNIILDTKTKKVVPRISLHKVNDAAVSPPPTDKMKLLSKFKLK